LQLENQFSAVMNPSPLSRCQFAMTFAPGKAFSIFLGKLCLGLLLAARTSRAAEIMALSVTGQVKTQLNLTVAELKTMPGAKANAKDYDRTTASYEGVALHEILRRAGVPQGESLRGEALGLCVLVKGADGYKVAFALAELDPLFTDRQVLLAYRRNGAELDVKAGPLRLVIPDEKRHGRWVRQVTEMEVVRVAGAKL
jgi:DMSO/TMAO reductase YedYZ molybdopterin-dependent catalytic subunit